MSWSSKRDRSEICQLGSLAWSSKTDMSEICQLESLPWSSKRDRSEMCKLWSLARSSKREGRGFASWREHGVEHKKRQLAGELVVEQ